MPQGILSWSTCRWHGCRCACWRISGSSSWPSPSPSPVPAAPSSAPACPHPRTWSAPARSRPRRCSCRPPSWPGAEVGCRHRQAVGTDRGSMGLSCVHTLTDIPSLLPSHRGGERPGGFRLLGCKRENEMMELGRSFSNLHFHVCEAQVQSGREQGCLWKSSFGLGTGTRVQIKVGTVPCSWENQRKTEGNHKKEWSLPHLGQERNSLRRKF